MTQEIHRAQSRGKADLGWLRSAHSFSFAGYYNPERMGFGKLRVLNDDVVAPGRGFDTHSHRNMEIVSIPLFGTLVHKDSRGHGTTISQGEVQIMSAGKGIAHSEYNHSQTEEVCFLQIWVEPREKETEPRYAQGAFRSANRLNQFQTIVSPLGTEGPGLKVNQDVFFSLIDMEEGQSAEYALQSVENGLYVFVLEGQISMADAELTSRDAMALTKIKDIELSATSDSSVLVIDVPLK